MYLDLTWQMNHYFPVYVCVDGVLKQKQYKKEKHYFHCNNNQTFYISTLI